MILSDESIDQFVISEVEDGSGFEAVMNLPEGSCGELTEENCSSLDLIAQILENEELSDSIVNFRLGSDELSHDNVISRLKLKHAHKRGISEEIVFISSHFDEFKVDELKILGYDLVEEIVSSKSL
jgi:hypothetical protein